MKVVQGTVNGTGAALTLCVGFIPDWVRVWNLESGTVEMADWNSSMRAAESIAGYLAADGVDVEKGLGLNVAIYRGGDVLSAASTVYHYADPLPDKRKSTTYGTINRWTLDTPGSLTGHFNVGADTTYVGEGSKVTIAEDVTRKVLCATITALTSNGEVADEVTLSEAIKSGDVRFLRGFADYIGMPAGATTLDGFTLSNTDLVATGELVAFACGIND